MRGAANRAHPRPGRRGTFCAVHCTEGDESSSFGAFAWVRNPIFTAMSPPGAGVALMRPNVVALSGLAVLVVSPQLQVPVVEEPYLRVVHGVDYADYSASTGRLVPGSAA